MRRDLTILGINLPLFLLTVPSPTPVGEGSKKTQKTYNRYSLVLTHLPNY